MSLRTGRRHAQRSQGVRVPAFAPQPLGAKTVLLTQRRAAPSASGQTVRRKAPARALPSRSYVPQAHWALGTGQAGREPCPQQRQGDVCRALSVLLSALTCPCHMLPSKITFGSKGPMFTHHLVAGWLGPCRPLPWSCRRVWPGRTVTRGARPASHVRQTMSWPLGVGPPAGLPVLFDKDGPSPRRLRPG